jgi:DNA-directed RNA polymerase subunit RPC12/RpoP
MAEYTCNSCGATVVTSATESAGTCPYCRSPIVIVQQTSGALTPDMVIPFRWTRDQAVESLQRLYRGKRLLPKVFSSQNFVDEVKGVYVPFWLYDFDADVNERYNASTVSTRYAGSRRYITTRNYVAIRQGNVKFMAIPVDGSANMPDAIMESIEPFDVSQAVPFQGSYLAGFMAERYDVDSQTAGGRAHERAVRSAGQIFARSVTGYRSVTPAGAQVTVKSAVVHYVLFPVWMLTTIWRGERFTFAMNGQTGRMVGDLPLDRKAYWRWFWLLAGSCGVAAGLISSLAVVLL